MRATNTTTNARAEVLEIIRELPGLAAPEIHTLMPHTPKSTVGSTLFKLKMQGYITVAGRKYITTEGKKRGVTKAYPTYQLSATPTPNVVPIKRKAPTEAGLNMQLKDLKDRITELEAWKREAIARYPDLAVAPAVLKAADRRGGSAGRW